VEKQGLEKPTISLQGSSRQVGGRILLKDISQILTTTANTSAIQEEQILTAIKNIAKQHIYDQQEEENMEEIKQSGNTVDEEFAELPLYTSLDHLEIHHQVNMAEEDIQIKDDEEEDIQIKDDKEEDMKRYDCIEEWLQIVIRSGQYFILQQFLALNQMNRSVLYIRVHIKFYILNMNVKPFVILLRTWLHWKYTYT
jgi:hypothetical protein